jgi:hypothetical protein
MAAVSSSLSSASSFLLMVASVASVAAVGCDRKATPSPAPEPVQATAVAKAAPLAPSAVARSAGGDAAPHAAKVELAEVPIRAGASTTVHVAWKTPEGTGVNEDAPFRVRWNRSDALAEAPSDVKATGSSARDGFRITVKPLDGAPNATLGGVIDIVVCDVATHSVCVPVRRTVEIEFVVAKAAAAEITVSVDLPQARVL